MLATMLRASGGAVSILSADHPNLVAMYTMDNISGSTLVDETGSFDGTISGATATTGYIGSALSFDGTTSDEVNLGSIGLVDGAISLWVNLTSVPSGSTQFPIIANWSTGQLSYILDSFDGNFRWVVQSGGTSYVRTSPATASSWVHIVAYSIDGASGLIINNGTPVTGTSISDLAFTGNDVYLGRKLDDATPRLNGLLDQIRFYDRQLTASEITELYNET